MQITNITNASGETVYLKANSAKRRFAWAKAEDGTETKIKDFAPGDSKKESEADTLARLVDYACAPAQGWNVERYEVDETAGEPSEETNGETTSEMLPPESETSDPEEIGEAEAEAEAELQESESAPAPTSEPTITAEASRKRLLQEIISTARREIFAVGIACTIEKVTVDGESVTVKFGSSHVADFTKVMHNMKESVYLFIEPAQGNLKFDTAQADTLAEQIELPLAMTLDGPMPEKPESLAIAEANMVPEDKTDGADESKNNEEADQSPDGDPVS